jgi:hypothetical protein
MFAVRIALHHTTRRAAALPESYCRRVKLLDSKAIFRAAGDFPFIAMARNVSSLKNQRGQRLANARRASCRISPIAVLSTIHPFTNAKMELRRCDTTS